MYYAKRNPQFSEWPLISDQIQISTTENSSSRSLQAHKKYPVDTPAADDWWLPAEVSCRDPQQPQTTHPIFYQTLTDDDDFALIQKDAAECVYFALNKGVWLWHVYLQVEDYEEEPLLRTGCKEYFWLLCKLIDNIHVKDASQVGNLYPSTDDHIDL